MDLNFCPDCGSEAVDYSVDSAEYKSWSEWLCQDCSWKYVSGGGFASSSGTHPKNFDTYCTECKHSFPSKEAIEAHRCTVKEIVSASDNPLSIDTVISKVEEWHRNGEKHVREAIMDKEIALTPTYFKVVEWEDGDGKYTTDAPDPDMFEPILTEIENEIEETNSSTVDPDDVCLRLATNSSLEEKFIYVCLQELRQKGRIRWGINGVSLPD